VQGRRRTLEDYHSMGWGGGREGGREGGRVGGREGEYQYYGIYDGHWGTKAAKFASATLHAHFAAIWEGEGEGGREGGVDPEALREAVREAFWRTNEDLKTLLKLSRGREGGKEGGREGGREGEAYDRSGTTATLALLFPEAGLLLVANVGDSRAVLCCEAGEEGGKEGGKERAVEMTVDHTASNLEERRVLETQGARVWRLQVREGRKGGGRDGDGEGRGGEDVWRLEGELALSRSLGDFQYDRFLSRDPHISLFSLAHGKGGREGGREGGRGGYRYLVLASDGLWDVMSNEDVVAFVDEKMSEVLRKGGREGMAQAGIEGESQCGEGGEGREGSEGRGSGGLEGWGVDWHALARALTWEAYVRGSTDNIGVLIVDLNR
jgi:protein phosphatase 1L